MSMGFRSGLEQRLGVEAGVAQLALQEIGPQHRLDLPNHGTAVDPGNGAGAPEPELSDGPVPEVHRRAGALDHAPLGPQAHHVLARLRRLGAGPGMARPQRGQLTAQGGVAAAGAGDHHQLVAFVRIMGRTGRARQELRVDGELDLKEFGSFERGFQGLGEDAGGDPRPRKRRFGVPVSGGHPFG